MTKERTMQDLVEAVLKLVDLNRINREQEDLPRTNHCAAHAEGLFGSLYYMGLEGDFGTYMDGDYEMVGHIRLEDVELVKNGEINWKAYGDAVVDDAHGWGAKVLRIGNREA